jgi:hypothetical protein
MTDEAPALVAAGGPPEPVEPPRTRIGLVAWGLSILLHAALIAALADLSDRLGSEPEYDVISAEWVIDVPLKEAAAVNAAAEASRAEAPAVAAEVTDATRLALLPSAATMVLEASGPPAAASAPPSEVLAPAALPADPVAPQQLVEASRPITEPPMLPPAASGENPVPPAATAPPDAPAVAGPPKTAAMPQAGALAPTRQPPADAPSPAALPADPAVPQQPAEASRPVAEPSMLPVAGRGEVPQPQAVAASLDAPAMAGPPPAAATPPAPAPPAGLALVPATALASLSAPGNLAPAATPNATAAPAGAPESLAIGSPAADAPAPRLESGVADARPVEAESVVSVLAPPALLPQETDPRRAIEAETLDLACGRVAATFTPDDGTVVLSGHLRSAQDRAAFVARLSTLAGVRRVADGDLHVVGEPYCRVLGFLGGPGLTRSEDQRHDVAAIGQPAQAGVVHIRAGRPLELQLGGPDFPSFVYVDYFTADGRVYHLLPAPGSKENRLGADERLALGGRNGRGLKATIGPPFGLDMVVAVAATRPVFAQSRPVVEDAAVYLAEFEAALAAARRDEGLRIEYSYFLIRTTPD